MDLDIESFDLGVKTLEIKKNLDERGFVAEIFRNDWLEFFDNHLPVQVNISMSKPGTIRAWHRHNRNQTDYFLVKRGKMKICIYDDNQNSKTCGKLVEIIADENNLKIIKVPGHFWHGTKTISSIPSETIYFLTNLYDYENPDEERLDWSDKKIIDPKTKNPYDWNSDEMKL